MFSIWKLFFGMRRSYKYVHLVKFLILLNFSNLQLRPIQILIQKDTHIFIQLNISTSL